MSTRPRILFLLAVVVAACTLDAGSFIGKTCNTAADCPSGYTCTEAHGPTIRTCEILYPDVTYVAGCAPKGPPLYYCGNVQAVLTQYCANCHTNPIPGIPNEVIPIFFRLDRYDDDPTLKFPDGGPILGSKSMAQRIYTRAVCQRDMPPGGFPQPREADRQALLDWAAQGALFCDGGVTPMDGGGISYANQISPIFAATTCTACHAGVSPPAGLNFSISSWGQLVNVPCGTGSSANTPCDAGVTRIVPFDAGASELWLKITNAASKCGASMPKGGTPLNTANPDAGALIFQWIAQGARNN